MLGFRMGQTRASKIISEEIREANERTVRPEESGAATTEKVQKTLRFPLDLFREIERCSIRAKETFQGYVMKLLATAVVESGEFALPAKIETPVKPEEPSVPKRISLVKLADLIGVTSRTAQNWSKEKGFPHPRGKEGKAFLYIQDEVLAFLKETKKLGEPVLVAGNREVPTISMAQLAGRLGLNPQTASNWSKQPGFPKSVSKKGRAVLYKEHEVARWVSEKKGLKLGVTKIEPTPVLPAAAVSEIVRIVKQTIEDARKGKD